MQDPHGELDPIGKRLVVFALLVLVALAAIWLIDRRAMQRQQQMQKRPRDAAVWVQPPEAPRPRMPTPAG